VFCNKLETCRRVENHLLRAGAVSGRVVLPYHEAVRDDIKKKNLETFLAPPSSSSSSSNSSRPGSQQQQQQVVLVCTDRTSRGIDSMFCEHVVLFDFPRDPSEYVRRVGRTARGAGGKGVVSILVLGKQVPLAQEIIARGEKGVPVHRVPALM
jgi:ATP-dependent RNA helicase DDX18/HAS1